MGWLFAARVPYSLPMHYRLYEPGDFPRLYAVEEACFGPRLRFSRSYMRQILANPDSAAWIAEAQTESAEGEIAGFAVADWMKADDETIAYIQTLEVAAKHRRLGVGAELLRRVEASTRAAGATLLWLHVDERNDAALGLYRAHGFLLLGREEHYYPQGGHALVLALPLAPAAGG